MNDTTVSNAAFVVGIGTFPATYKNGMVIGTDGNVDFPSGTNLKIGNLPELISLQASGGVAVFNNSPYFMLDGSANRWTIQNNGGDLQFLEKAGSTSDLELSLDEHGNMVVEGTGTYVNSLLVKNGNTQTGNRLAQIYDEGFFKTTGVLSLMYDNNTVVNINTNGDSYFNGGDIGIGTNNPTEKLEVYDNASSSGVITAESDYSGTNAIAGYFTALQGSNGVGIVASGSLYDFYASGSGTNYGPFTGGHEVMFSASSDIPSKPGLIVRATGTTHKRILDDGSVSLSSTLPEVMLASKENDKAVLGVLVSTAPLKETHWYKKTEGHTFATVNALGEGRVWVCSANGDIEAGDYITTSTLPGYGQKQEDDLLHNYTLGKAIETIRWEDVSETVTIDGKTYKVYLLAVVYTSG